MPKFEQHGTVLKEKQKKEGAIKTTKNKDTNKGIKFLLK
jgi:hypothetical protein